MRIVDAVSCKWKTPRRSAVPSRGLRRTVVTSAATLALGMSQPGLADAAAIYPTPPECTESQFHMVDEALILYAKEWEYTRRYSYGGGVETRYIWVFHVYAPHAYRGWITVGTAERHCGSEWAPGWA